MDKQRESPFHKLLWVRTLNAKYLKELDAARLLKCWHQHNGTPRDHMAGFQEWWIMNNGSFVKFKHRARWGSSVLSWSWIAWHQRPWRASNSQSLSDLAIEYCWPTSYKMPQICGDYNFVSAARQPMMRMMLKRSPFIDSILGWQWRWPR